MEGLFLFLVIAAVIAVRVVKQFKEETKGNADGKPFMLPGTEVEDDTFAPAAGEGDDTYGGYIPRGPSPEAVPASPPPGRPRKKQTPPPVAFHASRTSPQTPPTPDPADTEEPSEYAIRTAEEARRAVVWGEILQRKYF